jgi:ubiquinone/menaquinone biosynthesis C-methylase UbiE
MIGCDIWSGAYKAVFTKELCERNARAEGTPNARFERGDATKLPFADETFDAVTSNYVYHNIPMANRQNLLLETLRTLKTGGSFAIHDIMSERRYGDMEAFAKRLRDIGYEEVRLIDTTDGTFLGKKEAAWMDLAGSTLLVGRK